MARKCNTSASKRRNKSKNRRDYTRETTLALRSPGANRTAHQQEMEVLYSIGKDIIAAHARREARNTKRGH